MKWGKIKLLFIFFLSLNLCVLPRAFSKPSEEDGVIAGGEFEVGEFYLKFLMPFVDLDFLAPGKLKPSYLDSSDVELPPPLTEDFFNSLPEGVKEKLPEGIDLKVAFGSRLIGLENADLSSGLKLPAVRKIFVPGETAPAATPEIPSPPKPQIKSNLELTSLPKEFSETPLNFEYARLESRLSLWWKKLGIDKRKKYFPLKSLPIETQARIFFRINPKFVPLLASTPPQIREAVSKMDLHQPGNITEFKHTNPTHTQEEFERDYVIMRDLLQVRKELEDPERRLGIASFHQHLSVESTRDLSKFVILYQYLMLLRYANEGRIGEVLGPSARGIVDFAEDPTLNRGLVGFGKNQKNRIEVRASILPPLEQHRELRRLLKLPEKAALHEITDKIHELATEKNLRLISETGSFHLPAKISFFLDGLRGKRFEKESRILKERLGPIFRASLPESGADYHELFTQLQKFYDTIPISFSRPLIEESLEHPNPNVRLASLGALTRDSNHTPAMVKVLVESLEPSNPEQEDFVDELVLLMNEAKNKKKILGQTQALLASNDPTRQRRGIDLARLVDLNLPQQPDKFKAFLRSPDTEVVHSALKYLRHSPDLSDKTFLQDSVAEVLGSENLENVKLACELLEMMPPLKPEHQAKLLELRKKAGVMYSAVSVLANSAKLPFSMLKTLYAEVAQFDHFTLKALEYSIPKILKRLKPKQKQELIELLKPVLANPGSNAYLTADKLTEMLIAGRELSDWQIARSRRVDSTSTPSPTYSIDGDIMNTMTPNCAKTFRYDY